MQRLGQEHFVHVRCDGCRRIVLIAAAEMVTRRKSYKRLVDVAKDLPWSIYRDAVLNQ
jgi:hypothetical protein